LLLDFFLFWLSIVQHGFIPLAEIHGLRPGRP
jgi:hypothetical protein